MSARPPALPVRSAATFLAELLARQPGYTPGWTPDPGSAGDALVRIAARYAELLDEGLRQVPGRGQLAFFDRLGVSLLPAQSARAPVVFTLLPNSPLDVALPANAQIAALAPPTAPAPGAPAQQTDPLIFATTQTITLFGARLASLYSIDPGSDSFSDHSAQLTAGFTLFAADTPVEHAIYLGHSRLLALAGDADVALFVELGLGEPPANQRDLVLSWDYLSKDGWLPLEVIEDRTARLTRGGQILLRKNCGPDAREETLAGRTGYWIRGRVSREPITATVQQADPSGVALLEAAGHFRPGDRVTVDSLAESTISDLQGRRITLTPPLTTLEPGDLLRQVQHPAGLPPPGSDGVAAVPVIDDLRAQVSFTQSGLVPDAAYCDTLALDTGNSFRLFGMLPAPLTTFAVASKEVFSKRGAEIGLRFELQQPGQPAGGLSLSYEYFNGAEWRTLTGVFELRDSTQLFTINGEIAFRCPLDWAPSALNGERNLWLRIRIDTGGYGHPERLSVNPATPTSVIFTASTLAPPVVRRLSLRYSFQSQLDALDHCLTVNDFRFEDHSEDSRWPRRLFEPFRPVAERQSAVVFGFDRPLPTGLVSLYVAVPPASTLAAEEASDVVWEYSSPRGWTALAVLDETVGFRRSGMLQLVGPRDATPLDGHGGALYRVRARLKQGVAGAPAPVAGLWPNAVWATERQSFEREILGSSDGAPGQALRFLSGRVPVLEGEQIEVREWAGQGETWRTAVVGLPEERLVFERDAASEAPRAVWVRYEGRPHLAGSGPRDRHYTLERAGGLLRFGDGRHGMIPPAGAPVRATYGSGGGVAGNLPAGSVDELRAAVPYLLGATNVTPAAGGAETERLEQVRLRGAQRLRHRDQAISAEDIAWIAREASPAVAHARCLALHGPAGPGQRGWVTLLIVPDGEEPQPQPTPELLRRVQRHVAARVPAPVARRVRVLGPRYAVIAVVAEVVPRRPEEAATVESLLLARLARFLHPLRGGPEGEGWAFGRPVYQSQLAALIEATPGVDYARSVSLRIDGELCAELAPVPPDALAAPGDHELKLMLGEQP